MISKRFVFNAIAAAVAVSSVYLLVESDTRVLEQKPLPTSDGVVQKSNKEDVDVSKFHRRTPFSQPLFWR